MKTSAAVLRTIDDLTPDDFEQIQPGEQLITPDVQPANLRGLASAVIIQAILDTEPKKPLPEKAGAVLWLAGPDREGWADWAGQEIDPLHLLPNLAEVRRKLRRR